MRLREEDTGIRINLIVEIAKQTSSPVFCIEECRGYVDVLI